MTPDERSELISAIGDYLAVLNPEVDRKSIAQTTDADLTMLAVATLQRAARELDILAKHFAIAVKIDSDVMAAYQSVQADAATAERVAQKHAKAVKARTLRDGGLSIAQIAVRMKIATRTVERYLAPEKPPTG